MTLPPPLERESSSPTGELVPVVKPDSLPAHDREDAGPPSTLNDSYDLIRSPRLPEEGILWSLLRLSKDSGLPGGDGAIRVVVPEPMPGLARTESIRIQESPQSFFQLYATIEKQSGNANVVGVTSALAGEGKTTVALHLALIAAHSSFRRICLIDLSLGEDDLCRRVGAAAAPGGVIPFLEATNRSQIPQLEIQSVPGLTLLPAGGVPINAARTARAPRMATLIRAAREAFDLVIVDLPSVLSYNVSPIADHLDNVVVVTRAGVTPRGLVADAVESVGRDRVLGVVLNRVKTHRLRKPGAAR